MSARSSSAPAVRKRPSSTAADHKFEIGKAVQVADGKDVTIIANGLLVAQALLAADTLEGEGISARVIDMHTVKPLDRDAIRRRPRKPAPSWWRKSTWWTADWACAWRRWWPNHPCAMEFVGIQDTYAESGKPESFWKSMAWWRTTSWLRSQSSGAEELDRRCQKPDACRSSLLEQSPACLWLVRGRPRFRARLRRRRSSCSASPRKN